MPDLSFTCRCGQVKGTIADAGPESGNHVRSFCTSCRAAAIHTGAPDPGIGGVTLYQTTADKVSFSSGADRLAVFSFGSRNILRWQASCCGAALFNTLRSPARPMAAALADRLDDPAAIGPVIARAFAPQPEGKIRHENKRALIGDTIRRLVAARLSGRWKTTPFFDIATRQPVAPITLISPEARRALLPGSR